MLFLKALLFSEGGILPLIISYRIIS